MSHRTAVIFNIDGLRRDVFFRALETRAVPNLIRCIGEIESDFGLHLQPLAPLPTITFTCQATITTGARPHEHGVPGNEFFDRCRQISPSGQHHYAFDIGETLAFDDAVRVFRSARGLANDCLSKDTPTLYEWGAHRGLNSVVAHHMYSRGCTHWLRPSVIHLARLKKGIAWTAMPPEEFDDRMVAKVIKQIIRHGIPDILTVYFMGLDYASHRYGPETQEEFLVRYIDNKIGHVLNALTDGRRIDSFYFAVISDHGQVATVPDDRHALRVGLPFRRGFGTIFDELGLDVHDLPREDNRCDVVVGANGGLAQVYLRRSDAEWVVPPKNEEVFALADAFIQARETGARAPSLQGALDAILVRTAERDGWHGEYRIYTGGGQTIDTDDLRSPFQHSGAIELRSRLQGLSSARSGDLILVPNSKEGFFFGSPTKGIHGGITAEESECVLSYGWPGAPKQMANSLLRKLTDVTGEHRRLQGRTYIGLEDFMPAIQCLMERAE